MSIKQVLLSFVMITSTAVLPAHSITIGVDEVDSQDVDILVGSFSSLVKAFEKFAVNENSILEQRIDQVFDRFDQSLTCAIDQLLVKGQNTIEGSLPDFSAFRPEESDACKTSTLKNWGVGGTLDRVKYEQCVLRELITKKQVEMQAVSSGYSGLKEKANAAYCQFKKTPDAPEYPIAKEVYAQSSILVAAYSDIARLDGCGVSEPRALYICTLKYHDTQTTKLSLYRDIDVAHVDFSQLQNRVERLKPPSTKSHWLLWKNDVITNTQLSSYESVISDLRRQLELAELNRIRRKAKYDNAATIVRAHIPRIHNSLKSSNEALGKTHLKCGRWGSGYCWSLKWDTFDSLIAPLTNADNECQSTILDEGFSDFLTNNEKNICTTMASNSKKRVTEVLGYFNAENERQRRSSIEQEAMDRAPR